MNGTEVSGHEGRLEFRFKGGPWGLVCNRNFDRRIAKEICQKMGFPIALTFYLKMVLLYGDTAIRETYNIGLEQTIPLDRCKLSNTVSLRCYPTEHGEYSSTVMKLRL